MGHDVERHVDVGLVEDVVADVGLEGPEGEGVEQHRDVAPLLDELRQDRVALLLVRGVDVEELRLATQPFEILPDGGDVLESGLAVEVDSCDIIARSSERAGRALAEAARGAQNQRPLGSRRLRVCQPFLRRPVPGIIPRDR
mgnify:CR=1 FL=1